MAISEKDILKNFDELRAYFNQFKNRWYQNLNWFYGNQWVRLDTSSNKLIEKVTGDPKPRYKVTDNVIAPVIQARLAMMLKNDPSFSVVPINRQAAYDTAKLAEKYLRYLTRVNRFKKVLYDALFDADVTQLGIIKIYYDKTKGPVKNKYYIKQGRKEIEFIPDPTQPLPPDTIVKKMPLGEVTIKAISPFNFLFQPATDWDDVRECYEVYFMNKEVVESLYGLTIKENKIIEGFADDLDMSINQRVLNVSHSENRVAIVEYWRKPEYASGDPGCFAKFVPATNTFVEYVEGFPYEFNELPYEVIQTERMSHSVFGKSVVDDMLNLQRIHNMMYSKIYETADKMANLKVIAPEGALKPEAYTNEIGEILEYDPMLGAAGSAIRPLPSAEVPGYVRELLMLTKTSVELRGNLPSIVTGNLPDRTSGRALAMAITQVSSIIALPMEFVNETLSRIGYKALALMKQFYTEDRVLKISNDYNVMEEVRYKDFDMEMIGDIKIDIKPAIEDVKEFRRQIVQVLATAGLLQGTTPGQVIEMIDKGFYEDVYQDEITDVRWAQKENFLLLEKYAQTGETIEPKRYENHAQHIKIHKAFMNSVDFRKMIEENPEIEQVYLTHLDMHDKYLNENIMKNLQIQMLMAQQAGLKAAGRKSDLKIGEENVGDQGQGTATEG